MAILRELAIGSLLLIGSAREAPEPAPKLDLSAYQLSFDEEFARQPTFYDPKTAPAGRWKTNFAFGVQEPASKQAWRTRTLEANGELQYYGDPQAGTGSIAWSPGSLALVAQPNPRADDAATGRKPYLSGLITTERSFQQRYGYFEMRASLPIGQGLWSAFWLLPAFQRGPDGTARQPGQEIDVFENIGRDGEIHATVHRDDPGAVSRKKSDGERIATTSVELPHDYGVLVTRDEIVWYVDQHEVRRRPNVDFHQPAYLLVNLAVGGQWPGAPDATTRFPARMTIYSVKAYRPKPTVAVAGGHAL